MTLVRNIKDALTQIFGKDYNYYMNNPSNVKEIDLEVFVFEEEVKDLDLLSAFTNLNYLNISGTCVNDISSIIFLKNLEILYADFCKVTDISFVSHLKNLKEFDLSSPMDYINTLEPLRGLNKLEKLYVPDHPITTLEPIYNLDCLKILSIEGTEVLENEVEIFKKMQPYCEVWT
ncbi:hypothetical protein WAK64_21965 [Bacillus spongiae]|uniref:Leucine-rich repeat domain-containing protein n=1 Tax=Bacillus spongiae TaxID=2683610 RepID=A0ABU8HK80_9BACI